MSVVNEKAADVVRERVKHEHLDTYPLLEEASGVSNATWRPLLVQSKFPVRSHVRRKMSIGLGWTAESFDLLLDGRAPEEEPAESEGQRLRGLLTFNASHPSATDWERVVATMELHHEQRINEVSARLAELKTWRAAIDAWRAEVDQWRSGLSTPARTTSPDPESVGTESAATAATAGEERMRELRAVEAEAEEHLAEREPKRGERRA